MKLSTIYESIKGNNKPVFMASRALGAAIKYLNDNNATKSLRVLNKFLDDRTEQNWNQARIVIRTIANQLAKDEYNRQNQYADELVELANMPAEMAIAASYDLSPTAARGTKAMKTALNNATRRHVKRAMGPSGMFSLTHALGSQKMNIRPERQKEIFRDINANAADVDKTVKQNFKGGATRRPINY
jgi:hypothetical protein